MFKRFILCLCVLCFFVLGGCQKTPSSESIPTFEPHGEYYGDFSPNASPLTYHIFVQGQELFLPCTLAEFEQSGFQCLNPSIEYNAEESDAVNYKRVEFAMKNSESILVNLTSVSTTSGLKISEPVITEILNACTRKTDLVINGQIKLFSSLPEVLEAFGDNYHIAYTSTGRDITSGCAIISYGNKESGIIFTLVNSVVQDIQIIKTR